MKGFFLVLICFMLFTLIGYALFDSTCSLEQNLKNFRNEIPFIIISFILLRLLIYNFEVFILAIFFMIIYLILKTEEISVPSHFLICLLFTVICLWLIKQNDTDFLYAFSLFFALYKTVILHVKNRPLLILDQYPELTYLPKNSLSANVLYSKTLEKFGHVSIEVFSEWVSKNSKTQAKISELIHISVEKSIPHRNNLSKAGVGLTLTVGYGICNHRYKNNQVLQIQKDLDEAIRLSQHYSIYEKKILHSKRNYG